MMVLRGNEIGDFVNSWALQQAGLSEDILRSSIYEVNDLVFSIDQALLSHGVEHLSQTVELANLSSMLGNVFAAAVAKHSNGTFRRNGPHRYPDLLSNVLGISDIEVKFALETNKPKGHLIKIGRYLTCRYVLCDEHGFPKFGRSNRGIIPKIWEIRCGVLDTNHFSVSNTDGDSGKTAVVNRLGMDALTPVYIDKKILPYSDRSRIRQGLINL